MKRPGTAGKPPAKRGAKGSPTNGKPKGQLVLVVDDFDDAREMYAEFLIHSGFRVLEASNGAEALEQAFAHGPDLVLMDLSLPVMDGWEATRRLKSDDRTRHIPVVALTGHAFEKHSEEAREAGCDAFLAKPCLPDAMLSEVRRILDGHARSRK